MPREPRLPFFKITYTGEVFAEPRFQKFHLQNPGFRLRSLRNPGFKLDFCKTPVSGLARCETPVSDLARCKTPVSGVGFCRTPVSPHGLCKTPVSDAQNKTPVSSCIPGPVVEVCSKSPALVCKIPVSGDACLLHYYYFQNPGFESRNPVSRVHRRVESIATAHLTRRALA